MVQLMGKDQGQLLISIHHCFLSVSAENGPVITHLWSLTCRPSSIQSLKHMSEHQAATNFGWEKNRTERQGGIHRRELHLQ